MAVRREGGGVFTTGICTIPQDAVYRANALGRLHTQCLSSFFATNFTNYTNCNRSPPCRLSGSTELAERPVETGPLRRAQGAGVNAYPVFRF